MAGINWNGVVASLYESFNRIAQDNSVGNNTVLRLTDSDDKQTLSVTTGGDFIGNIGRFKETQDRNNLVRTAFLEMVKGKFDARTVAELPPKVQTALELNNFNVDENEQATTGRPLSARRVRAVLSAMDLEAIKSELSVMADPRLGAYDDYIKNPVDPTLQTLNDMIEQLSDRVTAYLTKVLQGQGNRTKALREAVNELVWGFGPTTPVESKIFQRSGTGKKILNTVMGRTVCLLAVAKARARVRRDVLNDEKVPLFDANAKEFDVVVRGIEGFKRILIDNPNFVGIVSDYAERTRTACDTFAGPHEAGTTIEKILDDLQTTFEDGDIQREGFVDYCFKKTFEYLDPYNNEHKPDQMSGFRNDRMVMTHVGGLTCLPESVLRHLCDFGDKLKNYMNVYFRKSDKVVESRAGVNDPYAMKLKQDGEEKQKFMRALEMRIVREELKSVRMFFNTPHLRRSENEKTLASVLWMLAIRNMLDTRFAAKTDYAKAIGIKSRDDSLLEFDKSSCLENPAYLEAAKKQMEKFKNLKIDDDSEVLKFLEDLQKAMEQEVAKEQAVQNHNAVNTETQSKVERCKQKVKDLFTKLNPASNTNEEFIFNVLRLVEAFMALLKVSSSRGSSGVDLSAQRLALELVHELAADIGETEDEAVKVVALFSALTSSSKFLERGFELGLHEWGYGKAGCRFLVELEHTDDGEMLIRHTEPEYRKNAIRLVKNLKKMNLEDEKTIKAFFAGRKKRDWLNGNQDLISARSELQKAKTCDLFGKILQLQCSLWDNMTDYLDADEKDLPDEISRDRLSRFLEAEAEKIREFSNNDNDIDSVEMPSLKCTAWLLALQVVKKTWVAIERGEYDPWTMKQKLQAATASLEQGEVPPEAYCKLAEKLTDEFRRLDIRDYDALTDFLDRLQQQLKAASVRQK